MPHSSPIRSRPRDKRYAEQCVADVGEGHALTLSTAFGGPGPIDWAPVSPSTSPAPVRARKSGLVGPDELLALTWLGRGDYTKEEWREALEEGRRIPTRRRRNT
jgi:hypothetical protein